MNRYALFSVNITDSLIDFANMLSSLNWQIIATDKPYGILKQSGIKVISIADFVRVDDDYGFPPTLHPRIEYALTSRDAKDRIELVYNVPYELELGNDVGGHTLLALAVKGNRLPVVTYDDMREVVNMLAECGEIPDDKRKELISKASFQIVKHYCSILSIAQDDNYSAVVMHKRYRLLNGENPYQAPADFMKTNSEDPLSLQKFSLVTDNIPCFTNMADIDCLIESFCKIALAFYKNKNKMPFIAIAAKHGNPCGVGVDWIDPLISIKKALWGNPLAIWGGEVVVNFPLTVEAANLFYASAERMEKYKNAKWMLDIILAPAIEDMALKILSQRKNTKIFINSDLSTPALPLEKWNYRFVRGAALRQPAHTYILDLKDAVHLGGLLSEEELDSVIIAWGCAFTSFHGGNEVAIASGGQLIGIGGGPSTVDATETAIHRCLKYNHSITRAVFATDAFFPFVDVPAILADAGCTAGISPSGGINIKKVEEFFVKRGTKVIFLPEDIRGFCRH